FLICLFGLLSHYSDISDMSVYYSISVFSILGMAIIIIYVCISISISIDERYPDEFMNQDQEMYFPIHITDD
ncbi:unnamed protein product, partial [marine sediment metagenome]